MLLHLALASLGPAHAAEVQFEGFYRARGRAFDTLTLDRTSPQNEGLAAYGQHRLWLRPKLLLSDRVGVFVDVRGLDGVLWGDQPAAAPTFGSGSSALPEYDLTAPTSATDEAAPLLDLTLWRAWGEVHTGIGHFTFGRVPLHWGTGLWLNDGLHVDPEFADHGDTTDRVMWELLVQDEFYVRAAVDLPSERFVGTGDDTAAYNAAVAYRTEEITAGLLVQLDHTGPRQNQGPLNVFTADLAADVTLGKLGLAAEAIGQFGGGDLEGGINDANLTAFGGALHADLDLDVWGLALRGGLASGDGEPNDLNLRTFTFDRDYSVGMFLFEQPMPTLAVSAAAANDTNQGRDTEGALTGTALSNALFLKPTVSRRIVDGWTVEGSWLGARVARTVKLDGVDQRRSYGNEFQLGVRFDGVEHFELGARLGVFLPGSVYSVSADAQTVTTFDDPAVGAQLTGRISF